MWQTNKIWLVIRQQNYKKQVRNSVSRRLAAWSSAKSLDFVVLEARLLPCISKIEYGKQERSVKLWHSETLCQTSGTGLFTLRRTGKIYAQLYSAYPTKLRNMRYWSAHIYLLAAIIKKNENSSNHTIFTLFFMS